ncbi:hypothetical protein V3C99_016362 [Haemonchus contortus]
MDKTAFLTVLLHGFKLGRTAKDTNIMLYGEKALHRNERFAAGFRSLEVEMSQWKAKSELVDHR